MGESMSADTITLIHEGLSVVTGIGMMVLAYLKFREGKSRKEIEDVKDHTVEMNEMKLKLAVLEERLSSEIHLLDKLDDKLSQLEREL